VNASRIMPMPRALLLWCVLSWSASVLAQTHRTPGLREQLRQDVADLQRNPSDDALREKIINLARAITPKLVAPPEADEQSGRASYAVKNAMSESDYMAAAESYGRASLFAPWVPEYYYNQGVAFEKAKRFDSAIAAFKWYLLAAPDAQDAKDVREHIGGLKYAAESAVRMREEQIRAEQEEARRQSEPQFVGTWRMIQDNVVIIKIFKTPGADLVVVQEGTPWVHGHAQIEGRNIKWRATMQNEINAYYNIWELTLSKNNDELSGYVTQFLANGTQLSHFTRTFQRIE
jgi:tetratricopeptide (TPR) repeat protein